MAEGGSLRFWGPGLLSTSPAFSMSSASHSAGSSGWPQKRELGPLSSGQGKSMQFVDPDRIEQSDRVQAASFALIGYHLPRRHRSSRGVKRKKHNLHSFIVASFNAQSVKGNDMACKRCEISTFIKDNGVDLFL